MTAMHPIDLFGQYAKTYMASVDHEPVSPSTDRVEALEKFDTPLQEDPVEANEVLGLLHGSGSPATVKSTGGRYFGFVNGGSLPAALLSKMMCTVWDQNAAMSVMSPVAARLEEIAGKWLLELFGLPAESGFGFVTGDTMANFTALAAARHQLLENAGWDVEAKGLFHAPEIKIIVGDEVHVSVLKALSMLGLGRDRHTRVPCDGQGRMIANSISLTDEPTIICVQAGNVNTGSFDPMAEICDRFKNKQVWIHVDAAFGLWAAASPEKKHFAEGIERADSWATDAHKWLNVPYDSGIVFVREKASLFAAMSATAAHLPMSATREPLQYVPEMSREARGIPVWAALKSLGRKRLAEMIERHCRQAMLFSELLAAEGAFILNTVVLNQVLVSFATREQTLQVISKVQQAGECWCGGTIWQGNTAMRISVSSWVTTDEDIRRAAGSVIAIAKAEQALSQYNQAGS